MFRELEQMLRMWEAHGFSSKGSWMDRFQQLLGEGPRATVSEHGNHIKVAIEAPGYRKRQQEWSMRVDDQTLYLRGVHEVELILNQDHGPSQSSKSYRSFVKAVPLPGPVERKPLQIRYEDGLMTVVLKRKKSEPRTDEWIPLSPNP